jgi:trans-aconitate methyltransferase
VPDARYRNYRHYIEEGWAREPKQSFQAVEHIMQRARGKALTGSALDVGCATGELIAYLSSRFPDLDMTGIDVFEPLLEKGRLLVPDARFVKASILAIPPELKRRFDIVTAIGVMSVFDERELAVFWRGLLDAASPDGFVVVLAPLNEYGVDTMIRHRKRLEGRALDWETGWNIHAIESVREVLAALGHEVTVERFQFSGRLPRREDAVRTWTLPTEENPLQLTNGLKLLVDHYFMTVDLRSAASRKGT